MQTTHTFHAETAADRDTAIAAVGKAQLATLNSASKQTDDICTANRIKTLRRRVRQSIACGDLRDLNRMAAEIDLIGLRVTMTFVDPWVSADRQSIAA